MVVKVKVLMNRAQINEAHETNRQNITKRSKLDSQYKHTEVLKNAKAEIVDVEIPTEIIEEKDLYIDASGLELAGENEHGMISVIYKGRDYQFVKTDELMNEIKERFK